jgi:hypothetical protein
MNSAALGELRITGKGVIPTPKDSVDGEDWTENALPVFDFGYQHRQRHAGRDI